MSFKFNWDIFDDAFYAFAKESLEALLNQVPKPANICAPLNIKDFYLGSTSPEFEIVEVMDLSLDKFRAIFRIAYRGNAYLVLHTKVQANPVNTTHGSKPTSGNRSSKDGNGSSGILAANKPLIVPLQLRLTDLRLNGLFRLSLNASHGLTLAFIDDPLESIEVGSSFDSLPKLRDHLQAEIEQKIRDALLIDLPKSLHESSLIWLHWLASKSRKAATTNGALASSSNAATTISSPSSRKSFAAPSTLVQRDRAQSPIARSSSLQWKLTSTVTTTTRHSLTLMATHDTPAPAATAAMNSSESTTHVSSKECIVLDHPILALGSGVSSSADSESYARSLLGSSLTLTAKRRADTASFKPSQSVDTGLASLLVSATDEIETSITLASHGIADRRLSSYFFAPTIASSESNHGHTTLRRRASLSYSAASLSAIVSGAGNGSGSGSGSGIGIGMDGSRPGIFSNHYQPCSMWSPLSLRSPLLYHSNRPLTSAATHTESDQLMNEHLLAYFSSSGTLLRPATMGHAAHSPGLQALLEDEALVQAHESALSSSGESEQHISSRTPSKQLLDDSEAFSELAASYTTSHQDPSALFSWTSQDSRTKFTLFHRKNK